MQNDKLPISTTVYLKMFNAINAIFEFSYINKKILQLHYIINSSTLIVMITLAITLAITAWYQRSYVILEARTIREY
jgi:hypothetical protein